MKKELHDVVELLVKNEDKLHDKNLFEIYISSCGDDILLLKLKEKLNKLHLTDELVFNNLMFLDSYGIAISYCKMIYELSQKRTEKSLSIALVAKKAETHTPKLFKLENLKTIAKLDTYLVAMKAVEELPDMTDKKIKRNYKNRSKNNVL